MTIREQLNALGYDSRDYDADVRGALEELSQRRQRDVTSPEPLWDRVARAARQVPAWVFKTPRQPTQEDFR